MKNVTPVKPITRNYELCDLFKLCNYELCDLDCIYCLIILVRRTLNFVSANNY